MEPLVLKHHLLRIGESNTYLLLDCASWPQKALKPKQIQHVHVVSTINTNDNNITSVALKSSSEARAQKRNKTK